MTMLHARAHAWIPKRRFHKTPSERYVVAALVVAVATLARALLSPALDHDLPFVTYFPAVVIVSWYGGLRPAILALVLSTLAAALWFLTPTSSLVLPDAAGRLGMALFLVLGLTTSLFIESLHTATRRAVAARVAAEHATAALAASEERYRSVFEHANDILY